MVSGNWCTLHKIGRDGMWHPSANHILTHPYPAPIDHSTSRTQADGLSVSHWLLFFHGGWSFLFSVLPFSLLFLPSPAISFCCVLSWKRGTWMDCWRIMLGAVLGFDAVCCALTPFSNSLHPNHLTDFLPIWLYAMIVYLVYINATLASGDTLIKINIFQSDVQMSKNENKM